MVSHQEGKLESSASCFFKQFEFVDKSDGWAHKKGRHYTPMTMISPGNKLSVLMGLRKGGCTLNGCFQVHFRTCGNKLAPTCYFSLSCCPQVQFITMHADDSSSRCSRGQFSTTARKGLHKFIIHNTSDRYGSVSLTSGQLIWNNMECNDKPHSLLCQNETLQGYAYDYLAYALLWTPPMEFSYNLGSTGMNA